MFELENVLLFETGKTLRKIKALQRYKKDYIGIRNIKQQYLNTLQSYVNYATINVECHSLSQQITLLDNQLADMDVKLNLLTKEL